MPRTKKDDVAEAAQLEPLAAFLARIEHQAQPLAVVQASHPDARDGIHQGIYAGIRLVTGEIGAILSDGSKI